MPNSIVYRGPAGELRAGPETAATLGPWTLTQIPGGDGFRVSAALRERNEHWLAYRPLTLVLPFGRREWRFRDVDVIPGEPCEIRGTGSPEIR